MIIDSDEKFRQLTYILTEPLTPHEFKHALDLHVHWLPVKLMYENLYSFWRTNRRKEPHEAAYIAMKRTRIWWLNNLPEDTKRKLIMEKVKLNGLIINLETVEPYGKKNPVEILRDGVSKRDLVKVLSSCIDPKAVPVILQLITQNGGSGRAYQVRMQPGPGGIGSLTLLVLPPRKLPPNIEIDFEDFNIPDEENA